MNSLEQAALSGALTSINLEDGLDPDGREPIRNGDDDESTTRLLINDDEDDNLELAGNENYFDQHSHQKLSSSKPDGRAVPFHLSSGVGNSNSSSTSSHSMARGWSGNTGPKGVLIDFKASHGKSGAILGGSDQRSGMFNPSYSTHYMKQKSQTQSLSVTRRPGSTVAVFSPFNTNSSSNNITNKQNRSASTSADSDSDSDQHRGQRRITNRLTLSQNNRKRRPDSSTSPPSLYLNGPGYNGSKPYRLNYRNQKLFGHLREVGVDNFIQAVEAEREDRDVIVLIHLYDPALESCVMVNNHLSNLARLYPRTKFLRALATELDFFNSTPKTDHHGFRLPMIPTSPKGSHEKKRSGDDKLFGERVLADQNQRPSFDLRDHRQFNLDRRKDDDYEEEKEFEESRIRRATDSDVLPTLIWYRGGEYVESLPGLERELSSGFNDRENSFKELKNLLYRHGIINDLDA
ncbi:hypothetical protein PPACK8108_LOCUS19358 [Phakopsora pachyrhizi]|uniref:Phosducin thioredoxin-like domain-containing protein n=1 Tax=Phakopsora pachyrhizi TaxID=170000 RepID=A0AAV0BDN1_PHAPC|nr:hypothetical protein PPACK8108_LOCUS19358 [Phakopsora pachyrhizi]